MIKILSIPVTIFYIYLLSEIDKLFSAPLNIFYLTMGIANLTIAINLIWLSEFWGNITTNFYASTRIPPITEKTPPRLVIILGFIFLLIPIILIINQS